MQASSPLPRCSRRSIDANYLGSSGQNEEEDGGPSSHQLPLPTSRRSAEQWPHHPWSIVTLPTSNMTEGGTAEYRESDDSRVHACFGAGHPRGAKCHLHQASAKSCNKSRLFQLCKCMQAVETNHQSASALPTARLDAKTCREGLACL